ncbi:iron chelate uptake ABC transporter family permease subunit [Klebsiella pneumoniae]|nr:iron chelate uptake ABC transporter family permease subunit [Klebsiella pneumoniae]
MPANHHPWLVQGSLALATLAIAVASLCFGQYPLSLSAVGHTLVHLPPGEGVIGQIVWSVRLPRVVMALLAGGALGLCGTTLQGVFQNPLVVPHLARLLVGADHRRLLPTAFWLGAALMLVVDDLARTLTQAEIPIGIITALLGAPLFTVLLVQSRRRSTTR